ncbi:MAG: YfiR family protein, partial [Acidobacteria bacterium]|nr:YfiR family protein [Acidobacteriota bacterium]
YIAREQGQAAQHLSDLAQMPILTVGEGRRFLEQGGLIAFQVENDRVRFDVNRRRAEGTGLIVSSKLLRVARELWPE